MGATVESSDGDSEEEEEEEEEEETSEASETRGETSNVVSSEDEENEDERTPSWIPKALTSIQAVDAHMIWLCLTLPTYRLPYLHRLRHAAARLVQHTDAAISLLTTQQSRLDKKALDAQISSLRLEIADKVKQSQAESHKHTLLLQQVRSAELEQRALFSKEVDDLEHSHRFEKEALLAKQALERRDLERQLEEEKDKSICCICHEKPRDTIILPCLHFQYCFSCLLRHRDVNINTCPTCRGPIRGLNMSSYHVA